MAVRLGNRPHAQRNPAVILFTLVTGLLLTHISSATADAADGCTALRDREIPASTIGLPTSGGTITDAQVIDEGPRQHCRVDAALHPVDPSAPDIRMAVAIPRQWNHKTFMFGGGGYNGTIPELSAPVPFADSAPTPLERGYATYASDSGHQADPDFGPTPSLDGRFGINDEAVRNFSGDALKKTHDAARYILTLRYPGERPARTYFAGGSTGGREALAVAQRWPRDFDGVIAAYPAWNAASLNLFFGHTARTLAEPGAFPNPAEQRLLHRAVVRECDGDDGVRDGIISNEPGCRFDPRVLRCPDGLDRGDSCLSDRQIAAVRTLTEPLRWDYRLGSGETGYPGFPFLSGADMSTTTLGMGTVAPGHPMPKKAGYGPQFWDQWIRAFVTRDPNANSLALDPRAPGRWQQRISRLAAMQDVNDADLRPFARSGGKLLLLHGTSDELVSHRSTADYFNRVRKTTGAVETDSFARFYLVPGANHAAREAVFAPGWDSVSALDSWAGHGTPPSHPVVTDTNPGARRSRPLCAYPGWPEYRGTGDPSRAASYTCQEG